MTDTPSLATPVGKQLPPELLLTPLVDGALAKSRPIMDWLTTFHLVTVVLDPFTNESSWILRTATRTLEQFRDSDARMSLTVTAGPAETTEFLGPLADQFLVFCDPDRTIVKAAGLTELPAFVFIRVDGVIAGCAQGWNATEWSTVAEAIADFTSWSTIVLPGPNDPGPFRGSPALG